MANIFSDVFISVWLLLDNILKENAMTNQR